MKEPGKLYLLSICQLYISINYIKFTLGSYVKLFDAVNTRMCRK